MNLLKTLLAAAALAFAIPGSAHAAPPWSDPVNAGDGSNPVVVGNAVAFNAPGSFPGVPLLRSVNGAPASRWNTSGAAFDAQFGAFAGRFYVGSNGSRHVIVGRLRGGRWRVWAHGPRTGGARVAAAPGAAVFSTFEAGGVGNVYMVRPDGKTQKLSARGHIRSVAVASNAHEVLAAWDRGGRLEYRLWRDDRGLERVVKLASVTAAMHLSVAISPVGNTLIAWVDQPVNEGGTNMRARIELSIDLTPPRLLERYPDLTVVSGDGVRAAFANGHELVVWTGRTAVRAWLDDHTSDLAPVAADGDTNQGVTDLAVRGGDAVVAIGTGSQILAAPLVNGAFAPTEAVSGAGQFLGRPSAGFDGTRALVAWRDPAAGVEVAQRAF